MADEPAAAHAPAPAFYAGADGSGRLRAWWTLLHPPYTAWHLSYVVIGACLVDPVNLGRLAATVLAFFLAVGVTAHALDELHGRPLRTGIPSWQLQAAAGVALAGAVVLGVVGTVELGLGLVPFIVVGVALVGAYNLELFGGRLHTQAGFAVAWGAFPAVTGAFSQSGRLSLAAAGAGAYAFWLSWAQRSLSNRARSLRRRVESVRGSEVGLDGTTTDITVAGLLAPLESALKAMTWATVALAVALLLARTRG